ncbi:hypothetical protein B0H14DRAFT_809142 [Mycena olivaceomarginata]|nr:hypothetical protein B0H14DRAFT_809142 [Mycena olivaceomarginata]
MGSTVVSVLFLALRCLFIVVSSLSFTSPLHFHRLPTRYVPTFHPEKSPLLFASTNQLFTVTNSRSFSDSLEEPPRHHGISSCPARTRRVRLLLIVFLFSALFWENCRRTTGQKQSTPCTSHVMRWIRTTAPPSWGLAIV